MCGQFTRRGLLHLAATAGVATTAAGLASASLLEADDVDERWLRWELRNYARTQEAPAEQASDPEFMRRWQRRSTKNAVDYADRVATEPEWRSHANLCATWGEQCTGNPNLYEDIDARDFYGTSGHRRRVAFYDREGARLSGHLWTPVESSPPAGKSHPGVVITNGSVQAPEPLYWWAAQALVEAGYVVLTYDPRGQGRSDSITPTGAPGGNANGDVFVTNQIDAIDFFRSTPEDPYEPNTAFSRDDGAPLEPYNPVFDQLDRSRLGIAGHSAGAIGASIVQGIQPWPTGGENPVDAVVAWDNLGDADDVGGDGVEGDATGVASLFDTVPDGNVEPRVPAMGQAGDYFLTPTPHARPPDPDGKVGGFTTWREAGVSTYQLVVRSGTHYEWSLLPTFPATSWEFGNALAEHYTVAWFDRWLKEPHEDGFHDADDRLLADDEWADHLSFHYRSKRAFDCRNQRRHESDDIRRENDEPAPPESIGEFAREL